MVSACSQQALKMLSLSSSKLIFRWGSHWTWDLWPVAPGFCLKVLVGIASPVQHKGQEAIWSLTMKLKVLPCSAWISGAQGQLTARGLQVSSRAGISWLEGGEPARLSAVSARRRWRCGPGTSEESSHFYKPRFLLAVFFLSCVPNLIKCRLYRERAYC